VEFIEFFLENGISLRQEPLDDSIMTLTKVSKYIANDPPSDILQLLIDYGAPIDYMEKFLFYLESNLERL